MLMGRQHLLQESSLYEGFVKIVKKFGCLVLSYNSIEVISWEQSYMLFWLGLNWLGKGAVGKWLEFNSLMTVNKVNQPIQENDPLSKVISECKQLASKD